jgi:hypothetical protein
VQLQLTLKVVPIAHEQATASAIVAEGVVANAGTESVALDLVELGSPSLALEIVDENGAPLRMPPPPTPGRPEPIVLEPGMQRSVVFRAFVPPTARPGRYRIRMRYRDARSDWVAFEIR